MKTITCRIEEIIVPESYLRKDVGDLQALTESVQRDGFIHSIVVNPQMELVSGRRRIAAAEALGMREVEVVVVNYKEPLLAQIDANECVKPLTKSERAAAAKDRARILGDRRGGQREITEIKPGQAEGSTEPSASGNREERNRTDEQAAAYAGFKGRKSYKQALAVKEGGHPDLVAAMDDTTVSVADAFKVLKYPLDVQQEAVASVKADKGGKVATAAARLTKQKAQQEAAAAKQAALDATASGDNPLIDPHKNSIPPEAEAAFKHVVGLPKVLAAIDAAVRAVKEWCACPAGARLIPSAVLAPLRTVRDEVAGKAPWGSCPYCSKKDARCPPKSGCGGMGWVTRWVYEQGKDAK